MRLSSIVAASCLLIASCLRCQSATITVSAADSGWYTDDGFHGATNQNYVVGQCINCLDQDPSTIFRNFVVFNLTGYSGITSATLRLYNPGAEGDPGNGFFSVEPSETYTLFDVGSPISTLTAGGSGLVAVFDDLGAGVIYGTRVVSDADNGTVVSITLNSAALAALEGFTGPFGFGGALTTLIIDSSPEVLFSRSGTQAISRTRELVLITSEIPEPGSGALVFLGAAAIFWVARRQGA